VQDLKLESHLAQACAGHGGGAANDLAEQLHAVRAASRKAWVPVLLQWFTDHTSEGHSRRIIEHLGEILAADGNGRCEPALTRDELFVLLASAYLHDVGMQDGVVEGISIDCHSPAQWDLVRRRHPRRSREIITKTVAPSRDDIPVGLADDTQYLELVGLVSEAHGSDFYEDALAELRASPIRPNNEPVRGAGLAALLLMADELDLHQVRVEQLWPTVKRIGLSAQSSMHFHVHHYVVRVQVTRGATKYRRRVELTLDFPEGADDYRGDVRELLGRRLLRQARRTNPVLLEQFDGEIAWDEQIVIDETGSRAAGRRTMPPDAVAFLRRSVTRDRIVDRTELVDELEQAVAERAARFACVHVRQREGSDLGVLLEWLTAHAVVEGAIPVQLDFENPVGRDLLDLGAKIRRQVVASELHDPADGERFPDDPNELTGRLRDAVASGALVLVVRGFEHAPANVRHWLRRTIDTIAASGAGACVVVTRSAKPAQLPFSSSRSLNPFTARQVARYLERRLGHPREEAEQTAEEMTRLSKGEPTLIATALQQRLAACIVRSAELGSAR
jgi:hypothetical protein